MSPGHYPDYDVLQEQDAWDQHTREIVLRRLEEPPPLRFLTQHEAKTLEAIARHLVYEHREPILRYVVSEADQKLSNPYGEAQREVGVPPAQTLVREGLAALDEIAHKRQGRPFFQLDIPVQFDMLAALQKGQLEAIPAWQQVPQKALFKKLAALVVQAYYSHPHVWSEIGYGGPAFPRGYLRIELGLRDPWEAKRRG